jgi:hypothetical protein
MFVPVKLLLPTRNGASGQEPPLVLPNVRPRIVLIVPEGIFIVDCRVMTCRLHMCTSNWRLRLMAPTGQAS